MKSIKEKLAETEAGRRAAGEKPAFSFGKLNLVLVLTGVAIASVWGLTHLPENRSPSVPNYGSSATPSAAESVASPAAVTPPSKTIVGSEADALMTDFKATVEPCDAAGAQAQAALQAPDTAPDVMYTAAKTAHDACRESWLALSGKLRPPRSADQPTTDAFKAAIEQCQQAYYGKMHTYEALAAAIESGLTPSTTAEVRKYSQVTQYALGQCVGGMISKVHDAGGQQSGLDS